MKTLILSLSLLLTSQVANAGWWDDAKDKAASIAESVKESTAEAYENTKEYIDENKDGWIESGKEMYKGIVGDDEQDDAKKK